MPLHARGRDERRRDLAGRDLRQYSVCLDSYPAPRALKRLVGEKYGKASADDVPLSREELLPSSCHPPEQNKAPPIKVAFISPRFNVP